MANYYGTSGADNLVGTSGNDTFFFTVAQLQDGDFVSGNGGSDTLQFTTAGTISTLGLAGVDQGITIRLANYGDNSIDLEARPDATLIGGDGNDTVESGGLVVMGGGNDRIGDVESIQANGGEIDTGDSVRGRQTGTITIATAGVTDLSTVSWFTALNLLATSGTNTVKIGASTFLGRVNGPYPINYTITAGASNDTIDASAASVSLIFDTGAGNDHLIGGSGRNVFKFSVASLDKNDSIAGGGYGVLQFTTAGTITASALSGVHGLAEVDLANGTNAIDLSSMPSVRVVGGNGNDTIRGAGLVVMGDGIDHLSQIDSVQAYVYQVTAQDVVSGRGTGGITFQGGGGPADLTNFSGFTSLFFLDASDVNVKLGATTLASTNGTPLTISASSSNNTIDASLATGNLVFDMSGAGNTLIGGSGNDIFNFAPADFVSGIRVVGGAGTDTLQFTQAGAVSSGGLAGVSGIERIVLAAGGNSIDVAALPQVTVVGGDGDDSVAHAALFVLGGGHDTGTAIGSIQANGGQIDANDRITGLQTGTITIATAGAADLTNVTGFTALNLLASSGTSTIKLGANTFQNRNAGPVPATFTITGGAGNDHIDASAANVSLVFDTGAGNDIILGGSGRNVFKFAVANLNGSDAISGGTGFGVLQFTTAGTITAAALSGVRGMSQIVLANGTNSIDVSGLPSITVIGSDGDDTIVHGALVVLGGGNDHVSQVTSIQANGGQIDARDQIAGIGTGTITIETSGSSDLSHVSGFASLVIADVASGPNSVTLGDHTLTGDATHPLTITSGAGADRIDASAALAAITISSGAGDDTLISGHGIDTLIGGAGNDSYYVNDSGDKVIEAAGGGTDTVYASVSYALATTQAIENLVLTGTANINATGNALDNTITGNAGNNVLTGGGGADTFFVTLGNDTITDFTAGSAAGHDVLAVDHTVFANYAAVMALAHQVGSDVVFTYDAANSLTLHDVTLASLVQSDFTFY